MKRKFLENTDPAFQRAYAQQVEAERFASRKQAILAIARGEVAAQKKEAQKALRNAPPVQLPPGYQRHDDFAAAAERIRLEDEIGAALDAQLAEDLRAIEKHFMLRRRHIKQMELARKILGEERFQAARLVAAARKKLR